VLHTAKYAERDSGDATAEAKARKAEKCLAFQNKHAVDCRRERVDFVLNSNTMEATRDANELGIVARSFPSFPLDRWAIHQRVGALSYDRGLRRTKINALGSFRSGLRQSSGRRKSESLVYVSRGIFIDLLSSWRAKERHCLPLC
jgi:hypothetical protein